MAAPRRGRQVTCFHVGHAVNPGEPTGLKQFRVPIGHHDGALWTSPARRATPSDPSLGRNAMEAIAMSGDQRPAGIAWRMAKTWNNPAVRRAYAT